MCRHAWLLPVIYTGNSLTSLYLSFLTPYGCFFLCSISGSTVPPHFHDLCHCLFFFFNFKSRVGGWVVLGVQPRLWTCQISDPFPSTYVLGHQPHCLYFIISLVSGLVCYNSHTIDVFLKKTLYCDAIHLL